MDLTLGRRIYTLFLTVRVLLLTILLGITVPAIMIAPIMTPLTPHTRISPVEVKGCTSNSAEGVIEWNQTFGGFEWDRGEWVEQTADGGYIITGIKDYESRQDVWLIKTDAAGNEMWNQTYGDSNPDWGYCGKQTADGGYIITGWTYSYGVASMDLWLIKTDASGNVEWNQTYGGPDQDYGRCLEQTVDGGYIITGSTGITITQDAPFSKGGDLWLIKTDAVGNVEWNQTYGHPSIKNHDRGEWVEQTADGGYIITGCYSGEDVYLIKTDAVGHAEWTQIFNGILEDVGECVEQTADGGYIITGGTGYYFDGGMADVWLIKTDAVGHVIWNRTYGGSKVDWGYWGGQTADGGYIITGETASYGAGIRDVWLIKTDAAGHAVWNQTYGGPDDDFGYCGGQTVDGSYIITGGTFSCFFCFGGDVWLIKVSETVVVTSLVVSETETITSSVVSEVPRDAVFWALAVLGIVLVWGKVSTKRKR